MRRPILPGDVSTVARALLAAPCGQRGAVLTAIFEGAQAALELERRAGCLHPEWGNGGLEAAARRYALADEPTFDHTDYLCCTIMVLLEMERRLAMAGGVGCAEDPQKP